MALDPACGPRLSVLGVIQHVALAQPQTWHAGSVHGPHPEHDLTHGPRASLQLQTWCVVPDSVHCLTQHVIPEPVRQVLPLV